MNKNFTSLDLMIDNMKLQFKETEELNKALDQIENQVEQSNEKPVKIEIPPPKKKKKCIIM